MENCEGRKMPLKIFEDMGEVFDSITDEVAGKLIKMMKRYFFDGEEPEQVEPVLALAWPMIRKMIDASRAASEAKAASGKKGAGRRWQKQETESGGTAEDSKAMANDSKAMADDGKQMANDSKPMANDAEQEQEQEQEQEHDLQQEQQIDARAREDEDGEMGETETYAWQNLRGMNRSNLEELQRFGLPGEVVRYAIDEACAAGAANWAYCRSILERYRRDGIDTAGKARADRNRRSVPIRGSGGVTAQDYHQRVYSEDQLRSPAADRLLREAEAMSEGRLVAL